MFDFINYSTQWKYYDDSSKLVIEKIRSESSSFVIEKIVELKPKMYSFFADSTSEHKKGKGANKNVFAILSHNEYRCIVE